MMIHLIVLNDHIVVLKDLVRLKKVRWVKFQTIKENWVIWDWSETDSSLPIIGSYDF